VPGSPSWSPAGSVLGLGVVDGIVATSTTAAAHARRDGV